MPVRRLLQALEECNAAQLQHILQLWSLNDEIDDRRSSTSISGKEAQGQQAHSNVHALLSRVQDPIAARFVWEALTSDERQLLYTIVAPKAGGITHDGIQKNTGIVEEPYEATITSLEYALLIQEQQESPSYLQHSQASSTTSHQKVRVLFPFYESQPTLYLVGKELFKPSESHVHWPLEKALSSLQAGQLQQIIIKHGIKLDFSRNRSKLAALFSKYLIEQGEVLVNLPELASQARTLYQWLRKRGGQANMSEVRTYTAADSLKLYELIEALTCHGLAFTTFKDQEHVLFIPHDLYTSLSKGNKKGAALSELVSPPANIKPAESIILKDLVTLIGAIYQQKIEPTQANKVPKRIATKLRPLLSGTERFNYDGEDDYLEILMFSAQQLNLVQRTHSPIPDIKPYYEPTGQAQIADWSKRSLAQQTQYLLRQWLTHFQWRDIAGFHFDEEHAYGLQVKAGRAKLLEYLKACVPERWYSIEALLRLLWETAPLAMRQGSPYMYRLEQFGAQALQQDYRYWRVTDGEIYIGMLANMLYELGIVALGYSNAAALAEETADNPDAFQLSQLGATVLALSDASQQPDEVNMSQQQALIVQPNFEVLLMQLDFVTLYQLLPFAQLNQVGMVSRLSLTRHSLLHGLEHGLTLEQIIQILQQQSQKEIPQNVLYMLNDWARAYQEAKISQVLLLEVSSEATATKLCSLRKLQEYTIRQVAPNLLLISSDINLHTLTNILEKEGIKAQLTGNFHTSRVPPSIY